MLTLTSNRVISAVSLFIRLIENASQARWELLLGGLRGCHGGGSQSAAISKFASGRLEEKRRCKGNAIEEKRKNQLKARYGQRMKVSSCASQ
jgi:hypothetical protein